MRIKTIIILVIPLVISVTSVNALKISNEDPSFQMEGGTSDTEADNTQIQRCTRNVCMDDEDSYKLECSVCQRHLHYRCTELLLYQLQHFMTKSCRKFVCTNCTTVEQWLIDAFPNEDLPSPMKKTTELSQPGT